MQRNATPWKAMAVGFVTHFLLCWPNHLHHLDGRSGDKCTT